MADRSAKPRPILVRWHDAGVVLDGSTMVPLETYTLGWLLKNGKDGLHIATDYVATLKDHGDSRHLILWSMIDGWWFLEIEE